VGELYHSGAEPSRSFSDDTERLRSSGFWSSSGAVEAQRQRGEFWTDCQAQLLSAAIILTGVGRSRSFMLSKVKIISDVTQVDEAAVSGAFGIWHDH
jgi:hypothetical protein